MDLEDCKQYVLFSEDLSVEVIDLHRVRQLKPQRSHLPGRSHLSPDGGGVSRAAVHRLAADGYGLGVATCRQTVEALIAPLSTAWEPPQRCRARTGRWQTSFTLAECCR